MSSSRIEYRLILQDQQFRKQLLANARELENLARQGSNGLKSVGAGAQSAGVQLGITAGVAGALTTELLRLGAEAIRVFSEITEESVRLASNLETTTIAFTGVLGDNPEAAEGVLKRLQQTALDLGASFEDVSKLATRFLPRAENVEQLDRLVKAAATLATIDPAQGVQGATLALSEGLGGGATGTRSLKERFEIPPDALRRIRELQAEFGNTEGLLRGLEEFFEDSGRNLDNFAETFERTQARVNTRLEEMKTTFGEPILDALTEQFSGFEEFLGQNREQILLIVGQLGDIVAGVVETIGNNLQGIGEGVDFERLQAFATRFFEIVEAVKLVGGQIFEFGKSLNGLLLDVTLVDEAFAFLANIISRVDEAMVTLTQITGLVTAGINALRAVISPTVELINKLGGAVISLFNLDFSEFNNQIDEAFKAVEDGFIDLDAAQDAARKTLADTNARIAEYNQALDENTDRQRERKAALEEDNEAALELANSILALQQAERDLSDAQQAATEAENERTDAIEESTRKRIELERRQEEARTETLIRQSEKRVQIELSTAQKRDRAIFDSQLDSKNAELDFPQEIVQAERDAADERRQIAEDLKNARIKAERDYQNELRRLQAQFDEAALEAERSNDVTAFLSAQRQLRSGQAAAGTRRDERLVDAEQTAREGREAARAELEREVDDLRETNNQKALERDKDLQDRLAKLDFQHQQELEKQDLRDQQEIDRQDRKFILELERFDRKEAEKLAKFEAALDEQLQVLKDALVAELEAVKAVEEAKLNVKVSKAKEALVEVQKISRQLGDVFGSSGRSSSTLSFPTKDSNLPIPSLPVAFKRTASRNVPTTPEQLPVIVSPNEPERFRAPLGALQPSNVNNSRSLNIEQMLVGSGEDVGDPKLRAMLQLMVREEIGRTLGT